MIKVGSRWTCLSSKVYGYDYYDIALVLEYSFIDDLVKTENQRTKVIHWLPESTINMSFISGDAPMSFDSLDDQIGKGLTPKCECGSFKAYGTQIERWQHSDWCPIYLKK